MGMRLVPRPVRDVPGYRKKKWVEALLTKQAAIEDVLEVPIGRMLGCGHWGCVFESTTPFVVKFSIDPTEGPIWSKIVGLVREEQYGGMGFPNIKSITRLMPDISHSGKKRKVWAIVRDGHRARVHGCARLASLQ